MRLKAPILAICFAFPIVVERLAAEPLPTPTDHSANPAAATDAASLAQNGSPSPPSAAPSVPSATNSPAALPMASRPPVAASNTPVPINAVRRKIGLVPRKVHRLGTLTRPRHIANGYVSAPGIIFEPRPEVVGATIRRCNVISCPRFVLLGVGY
jgi:hypothetical protein